jgi:hypothetical protein
MLGISLFIPVFLAYSLYVDLSGTMFLSSDMSFEDPEDEDLSTCLNEFKVFVPTVTSNPLPPWTHFDRGSGLFSPSLTSDTQITPVLRCLANPPSFFFILSQVGPYRYTFLTSNLLGGLA